MHEIRLYCRRAGDKKRNRPGFPDLLQLSRTLAMRLPSPRRKPQTKLTQRDATVTVTAPFIPVLGGTFLQL